MSTKYVKTSKPIQVGSIVRHSGNGSNFRKVVAIENGMATVESYGQFTQATGMVPAKCKVRRTFPIGTQTGYTGTMANDRKFVAGAYLKAWGHASNYVLYHVEPQHEIH